VEKMTTLLIIGWFAVLIFSYKGAELLLNKSGRL
jgi:hypothetical protein